MQNIVRWFHQTLDGKVQFENAYKERHDKKDTQNLSSVFARITFLVGMYARFDIGGHARWDRIRKECGLEEAMITIEEDYRRRGTWNRSTYDYYLRCWGRRTTFPRFPANFVENGAYDRKISSRANLVRAFERSTCEIKKGEKGRTCARYKSFHS